MSDKSNVQEASSTLRLEVFCFRPTRFCFEVSLLLASHWSSQAGNETGGNFEIKEGKPRFCKGAILNVDDKIKGGLHKKDKRESFAKLFLTGIVCRYTATSPNVRAKKV